MAYAQRRELFSVFLDWYLEPNDRLELIEAVEFLSRVTKQPKEQVLMVAIFEPKASAYLYDLVQSMKME